MAAVEYFNAVRRAGYQAATLLGIVATAAFPLAVYWKGVAAYPLMAAVLVIAALCWHLAEAEADARVVESVGLTLLGVGWIGGLGSFAALMLAPTTTPHGTGFLITAVLATVAYDAGGFFVGRAAGTRPLSEASPNKTVEGLVGGIVVSVVVVAVVVGGFGLAPFDSFGDAVTVALAAAAVAWLGDLSESLVKRDLGIKDMSGVLPGHGGVFDRIDAMLFVMPAVYYAAVAFHLLGS
jgi:phosphatidate cytidylyltransferase